MTEEEKQKEMFELQMKASEAGHADLLQTMKKTHSKKTKKKIEESKDVFTAAFDELAEIAKKSHLPEHLATHISKMLLPTQPLFSASQETTTDKDCVVFESNFKAIVKVVKMPGAKLPQSQTQGAAGYDLCANNQFPIILRPGEYQMIPTGLKMEIPQGWCAEVYSRSGLAAKKGIAVLNAPGLIDSDFRGELQVILFNHGKSELVITQGDRIAQLRVKKLEEVTFVEVDQLDDTDRGSGGFGSTGI